MFTHRGGSCTFAEFLISKSTFMLGGVRGVALVYLLGHTIRKCKKMAGQNTFKILLLNDANIIGEH